MKILNYSYRDVDEEGWRFTKVDFSSLNLLVGDSATGKTRFLNTIFNLGCFAASNKYSKGSWEITFDLADIKYKWSLETNDSEEDGAIIREKIVIVDELQDTLLIDRDVKNFRFLDQSLPQLPPKETSVHLLKEEAAIKAIYSGFSNIKHRRFYHDELSKISKYQAAPLKLFDQFKKNKNLDILYRRDANLNLDLFFLHKYFRNIFDTLSEHYQAVFPFVSRISVRDLGELHTEIGTGGLVPVAGIVEKGNNKWIPIGELSSGMQKVLLILTDIFILPDGAIYLIDEYENSLGIGAIEFLPSFMQEIEKDLQFFIASHHPYLINNIPVKNWYVFHREGAEVTIKFGDELVERYGRSKQQAFIQLINDPFYTEGVQ